jgi:transcriptional regulator with XRE-family HTH domain
MPRAKKMPSEASEEAILDGEAEARGLRMSGPEFSRLRASLGKSQRELAGILGLSLKAIESYEQGWRNVPAHVERLLYFLLFKLNEDEIEAEEPCWESKACSDERRSKCVAYVAKEGRFCWFFTGRLCASGEDGCYACDVFTKMLSRVDGGNCQCQ